MVNMDVELWRLFVQIAQHESITRVADARGVAQSVVSRQLATIEKICGGRLFVRTGRGVQLNEAGTRIYPRVVAWLDEGQQLTKDASLGAHVISGLVRVGVLASLSGDFATELYRRTLTAHPEIRLRFLDGAAGQIAGWLDADAVDLGIVVRNVKDERKGDTPVAALSTCLVGPSGDSFTSQATVAFNRLHDLPLVVAGAPNASRDLFEHLARRRGIRLNVALECNSIPLQKHLVATAGLYAILGAHAIQEEVQAGRLQAARIVSPELVRTIVLGTPETRPPTAATRAVLAIAESVLQSTTLTAAKRSTPR